MRKLALCIENKEADQLLCFCYVDSTVPLLLSFKPLTIFCTAWFVSNLVGNMEDRFSHEAAHIFFRVLIHLE